MTNLREIVNKIEENTGMTKEQIQQLINEKMDEYGNLVTEVGAALVVARELDVDISDDADNTIPQPTTISIDQLVPGLNNVSVIGRINKIFGKVTFQRKSDNKQGVVQSLFIEDKSGEVKVVCWDQKVDDLENSKCSIGDPIRIIGAYTKEGKDGICEVHIGNRGFIQVRPSDLDEGKLPNLNISFTKINKIKGNEANLSIIGKIIEIDENILHFQRDDGSKGEKISCVIGDETGKVKVNCWNEKVKHIQMFNVNDVVSLVGVKAKIGLDYKIELHTSRYSKIVKEEDYKIEVKDEFVTAQSDEKKKTKIGLIKTAGQVISCEGTITAIYPIREFQRSTGDRGLVRNIIISDETGTIRVVCWDDSAKSVSDDNLNHRLTIIDGFSRYGRTKDIIEIHCGNQTRLEISKKEEVDTSNVNFVMINEISDNIDEVSIIGKIVEIEQAKTVIVKDKEITLQALKVRDNTGTIRVTAWRNNIKKISECEEGNIIKIIRARVKRNQNYPSELTISDRTIIVRLNQKSGVTDFISGLTMADLEATEDKIYDIEEVKEGMEVSIQGTITKILNKPFIYALCPTCRKKLEINDDQQYICKEHGVINEPVYFLVIDFILNDGTGEINVVATNNIAEKILKMSAEEVANFIKKQDSDKAPYIYLKSKDFEGKIIKVKGKVRKNNYTQNIELKLIEDIKEINFTEVTKQIISSNYE